MLDRRSIIFAAVAATMTIAGANAQQSDLSTVQAAETEWYEALMAASGPRLERLLAGEFTYQHPTGNTYNKAEIVNTFATRAITVTKIGPVDRTVRDYGQTAVVFGSNHIEGVLSGQNYAGTIRFVNVWRNMNGTWQIVHRNSEILPTR
jgi:ketosteroid isomerase-like protein